MTHTFISPLADCQLLAKVYVNHLGDLSLPRNGVVRLTDHPNKTIVVYRGC